MPYLEPCQTSKMERFAKKVSGLWSLTISEKCSILDVCQCSKCFSALRHHLVTVQEYLFLN